MRNNSCSRPEFQSVGYCHSWSHCSFAAPTRSEPLSTKEKLPNLATSLGTWAAHPACPLHLFWDAGLFLPLLSQGDTNPWKKSFIFKWGCLSSCFRCTFSLLLPHCTSPACVWQCSWYYVYQQNVLGCLSSSDDLLSLCKQVVCLFCAVPLSQQPES